MAQEGKATTVKKTFSRETSVYININADPSVVWALLTNASDYARWNSTVVSLEGEIVQGEQIALKSTLDPKRTFTLKVKEFEPEKRLVWGDNMGNRAYIIEKGEAGQVTFTMSERIGGPLFPLFARAIPSFDESFEQIAADLKKEAETISSSKN
ncbi:MAG: SRPBCC domain-containing protein [Chloroflexi bacterium]|nr:MAG: SRPBCC domain-containing protein [Chloroflexota bacterium]MBL1193248.1 SRPBCC domain-containing protein [Chloroflexota bacterium]NOH10543.1 SRPBCC domain-containing protein [Chloroflexota bacterium]